MHSGVRQGPGSTEQGWYAQPPLPRTVLGPSWRVLSLLFHGWFTPALLQILLMSNRCLLPSLHRAAAPSGARHHPRGYLQGREMTAIHTALFKRRSRAPCSVWSGQKQSRGLGLDTAHLLLSSRATSHLLLGCPLGKTSSTPVHCSSLLATLSLHRRGNRHLSSSASETSRCLSWEGWIKSNIRYKSQLSPVTKCWSPVSFSAV